MKALITTTALLAALIAGNYAIDHAPDLVLNILGPVAALSIVAIPAILLVRWSTRGQR